MQTFIKLYFQNVFKQNLVFLRANITARVKCGFFFFSLSMEYFLSRLSRGIITKIF